MVEESARSLCLSGTNKSSTEPKKEISNPILRLAQEGSEEDDRKYKVDNDMSRERE